MFNTAEYDPRHDSTKGKGTDDEIQIVSTDKTCGCGCGSPKGDKARFAIGHDARMKGKLIRAHLAGKKVNINGESYPALAVAEDNGWKAIIEKSAATHAAAVEKAEARRAAIAERKAQTAEAKAAKDAEKAAAREAAKAEREKAAAAKADANKMVTDGEIVGTEGKAKIDRRVQTVQVIGTKSDGAVLVVKYKVDGRGAAKTKDIKAATFTANVAA